MAASAGQDLLSDLLFVVALVLSATPTQYSWAMYIDPAVSFIIHRLFTAGGIPGDLLLPHGPVRQDS